MNGTEDTPDDVVDLRKAISVFVAEEMKKRGIEPEDGVLAVLQVAGVGLTCLPGDMPKNLQWGTTNMLLAALRASDGSFKIGMIEAQVRQPKGYDA